MRADKAEKQQYLRDYKLSKGCSECGYNETAEALDYDHVDRSLKRMKMSKAHNYSWANLLQELENCVVLCANCHRKKTTEDKDYLEVNTADKTEEVRQYDLFGDLV